MLQQKLRAALVLPGEKRSDRFFRLFPWVWLVVAYCVTMLVLCLYGRNYIDSDIAGDMMLADILNRDGGLLADSWWYSSELRVVYLQLLWRLALLVFPHDWYAAQMLGQAGWMLLLILAYLYMARGLKLKNSGVWGAAALACPFGVWYLWYGAFAGAYLPHMILVLLSFGAVLRLAEPAPPLRRVGQRALLLGSAAASGLNGIKGLMGFSLPTVAAMALAVMLCWWQKPACLPKRALRHLGACCAAAAVAGAGYVLYSKVLADAYSFESYNGRTWSGLDLGGLLTQWGEFLSLFGYPTDSALKTHTRIFSVEGILAALGVLTAGAILVSLLRLLGRWQTLRKEQRTAPLLLASICVIQGMIFACTQDVAPIDARYWLTVVPFAFPVLQLEGETESFRPGFVRYAAALAFCVCITATSIASVRQFFADGMRTNPHLKTVCDWLVDQGYTQGYATFWNGNVLTEWSSGEIEMWVVGDFNTLNLSEGLQEMSHKEPPQGKVFLITTRQELEILGLTSLPEASDVVYEDLQEKPPSPFGHYVVMEYPDTQAMQEAVAATRAAEQAPA